MEREIKFRGKVGHPELDIFLSDVKSGDWVYGDLGNCNCIFLSEDKLRRRGFFVEEDTIGQFTGRCDKNGKEIYEGDIIRYAEMYFEVKFDMASGCWIAVCYRNVTSTKMLYDFKIDRIEVVGNVYDNPELIEKED